MLYSYLLRRLRFISKKDNALFLHVFHLRLFYHPRLVRFFLRYFFFAYAIRRLLRLAVPAVRGPWIGRTGALNKVAIKRGKSYAVDCMPSQGLGPRQSVLPLLISFLFSHIVLAEL